MLRIIVAESLKDAAFGNCLSESAPERTAVALSGVFSNWRDQGLLDIDDPRQAADSFCALLVHKVQMSALCGVPEPMTEEEQTRHIDHVVRTICCRSEEHTSELHSLMRTSYAVFFLKKKHT